MIKIGECAYIAAEHVASVGIASDGIGYINMIDGREIPLVHATPGLINELVNQIEAEIRYNRMLSLAKK